MGESEVKYLVISPLYPVGNRIAIGIHLIRFDDTCFQERNHRHGKEERHHQIDGNGNGEVLQTVVEHTLHRDQEGIEDGADTDGS